jgi:RHH-type proline utilization regulon transcriptional repressor/proline dehydrogenase/delta 1-pyrroline-5-carboxylate dehydrogenase
VESFPLSPISQLDQRTISIGRDLFARSRASSPTAGEGWLDRQLMDLTMRDSAVKGQLFQFIDVLPALSRDGQITRHLREYLEPVRGRLPLGSGRLLGLIPRNSVAGVADAGSSDGSAGPGSATPTTDRHFGWVGGLATHLLANLTRRNATRMARRFIAATDVPEVIAAVEELRRRSLAFTIDLLGEAVLSAEEARRYQQAYLDITEGLSDASSRWREIPQIDAGPTGPIPPVNISIKLSSLYSQFDPLDADRTSGAVREMLTPILRLARKRGAFVNIDMEQYSYKDLTLRIFRDCFGAGEFANWPNVGIAIQAYLRDTHGDLERLIEWTQRRGTPIWIRLVKGAYWDYERIVAEQNHWPSPVFDFKYETDVNFEACTELLMRNHAVLKPAIASHNIRSIAHAIALAEEMGLPPRSYEFQMLFGMAEPIKQALVDLGHRVRVYTPFGQLLPGMAYLVRRLLENTSNESFLRAGFTEHRPEEELLMNPLQLLQRRPPAKRIAPSPTAAGRPAEPFRNEPLTDFSRDSARRTMVNAISALQPYLGHTYPLVIAGQRIESGETVESWNPSHHRQLVGRAVAASAEQAKGAISAAAAAFGAWRDTPPADRAALLRNAAAIMRQRRFELCAWEIFETGKQFREADADVAEAIDYCEYYSQQMLRLVAPQRSDVPGEENQTIYEPRGVAVTIAPWNFPLAILCGMTAAALVAGNTVIMKPAEQSPIVAAKLMEIFESAGFPPGVVNYLPGRGEIVGPALVGDPRVVMIAFTGSRAVGLGIQESASKLAEGQDHLKRIITEMGGKNAIIVDEDADLDQAVAGTVASAFGYAGQKCSAASRVIVIESIYDTFLSRLIDATRSLQIGPAEDPGAFVGPVIDDEARDRILKTIETAEPQSRLAYSADIAALREEGCYVAPTIFAEVNPDSPVAQEEIFGPVLCVLKAADMTHALAIANGTRYALTGGLFSRSPASIARAKKEFRVGNLYINRKITGALVGRQPFGGFKLSGTGPKAGGTDYLPQFMLERTITEQTLRHGFAPESRGE